VAADLRRHAERLQATLEDEVAIEQAKGLLSERLGVSIEEAGAALERSAAERGISPRAAARALLDWRRG
jgi:AmiR/NasT family two-component response regulator